MGELYYNTALFGKCMWANEKVDLGVLETLIGRSNLFAYQNKHFFLFSKFRFTKGSVEKAKRLGNVTLKAYIDSELPITVLMQSHPIASLYI